MRNPPFSAIALWLLVSAGFTAFGQDGGGPCNCPKCRQAALEAQQQQAAALQQAAYAQQQALASGVQLAGHQPATPYPVFDPNGPHSYGGGTFPYGSPYDHGHPGRPFDGGRYGYFGGAHRTPGYPHHHFHREYVGPQGPPTAQVAYPYYTIRGPRDFLLDNPPSIGR
jgi:hypothetical protein